MTEQEFLKQIWRPHDKITTTDGVPGKVLGVSFTTKSVRAFISGAPEWVHCDLIETHTTGKGGDADDAAIIEELHNKVINQKSEIDHLREEKAALEEKIRRNYLADLLRAVNMMHQGLAEKKNKLEKIECGLQVIEEVASKVNL